MERSYKSKKYNRNGREILAFQYTEDYKQYLIDDNIDNFEENYYIVIPGMADTEFFWYSKSKVLKIVYSNYLNTYENVTPENYREPETININDFIVKENNSYHIETEEYFNNLIISDNKQKIIDILYEYSSDVKAKSSLMETGENEECLWSGEYEKVADKILHIFNK